ncbi:hypothetical protein [Bacteroides sp. 224]|uniref:hypothetical protein n=1 Tax=Bacteroides sp. 224 TaxID=2302936 RepID=UPI0013D3CE97|nr:hypothetical protein [Bacteroides sp. 224]
MHYIIITLAIAIILILQLALFFSTKAKIRIFQQIFPQTERFELGIHEEGDAIINRFSNPVLNSIINSINNYLAKNKGAVSDFHLMKDIVDRNCDSVEEEINTQIPMPLYLGLVGTMLGILIGIGFLVVTGSLDKLLNPSSTSTDAKGITELFGGVALAMVASIIGILLTTIGSNLAKEAKKKTEKGKNIFLSWIQAELLPELSNDTTAVLEKMVRNLTGFNNTFSENTHELRATLQAVNESYHNQAELMQSINQLKIGKIATANIEVYEKLKNCTNEIEVFAEYLHKSNEYLTTIQKMNSTLDGYEKRTQTIEKAGNFFDKNEKWLTESLDSINIETKDTLKRFGEMMAESVGKIKDSLDSHNLSFKNSANEQAEVLSEIIIKQREDFQKKLEETNLIVDELKNLSAVKMSISNLEEATKQQNQKMDSLIQTIRQLAEAKSSGTSEVLVTPEIKVDTKMPRWVKIVGITAGSLLIISHLSYLIPQLIEWISNLINR